MLIGSGGSLVLTYGRILLIGCIVCIILAIRWTQPSPKNTPYVPFAGFFPSSRKTRRLLWGKRGLYLLALLLCFFILSYPKRAIDNTQEQKWGIDIVIALDVSSSMDANDLTPSRLEAAKQALITFLQSRETDRVGLVLFAGKPFTSVPLTFDYKIFEEMLSRITTQTINQQLTHLQGTAIGDALLNALTMLKKTREEENSEGRKQIIVLFTDGEANVGQDPLLVASLADDQHIPIYTIGIGSQQGGYITVPTAFGSRQFQIPGLNDTSLQEIARRTQAQYARAETAEDLQEIIASIDTIERTVAEAESIHQYQDARFPFLLALAGCFLIILYTEHRLRIL